MTLEEFRLKYKYEAATTMMQQYLDIKFANLDCLLLFRMGDFYEMFFEDAVIASQVLGIALTKRGKNGDEEIAMCGVPYHSLDTYLNKLIEENFKIAICEQLETPEEAKKRGGYKAVVNREVTRIITPGTVLEESLIVAHQPNYLASLVIMKNRASICLVDLSILEIFLVEIPESEVLNELARLTPKEILLSENHRTKQLTSDIVTQLRLRISYQVDSFFAYKKCHKITLDFYKIYDLKAIGELSDCQISSIGSILEYLSLTQKHNIPALPFPKIINYHNFMIIDSATRRNLEITSNLLGQTKGSILNTLDHTVTKAGSRLLYYFLSAPLIDIQEINHRQDITNFFYSHIPLVENIKKILKTTGDLERCLARITMNRGCGRDLLNIKYTLDAALRIKGEFVNHCGLNFPSYIEDLIKPLSGNEEISDLIDQAICEDAPSYLNEGGIIKHTYHPKVQQLYDLINNGKTHVEKLKHQYRLDTGIENLKISHNNVLGLFIEITARHNEKMSDNQFIHRQTTTNSVRYTTADLQKLESEMVNARSLVINLEVELYKKICSEVTKEAHILRLVANSLNNLDVFCNFAHIAYEYNYVRPVLVEDLNFEITKGRHPVVEQSLLCEKKTFVSNDCTLSQTNRIWLITGPNMAGKSTFLRQNAIIAILAQIGSFVPAASSKIGIVDKIFSRIGAGDDLMSGNSTFMVEMLETSAILAQSTARSLVILDEIGRGTSTYDGVSIAWAVLEYIHDKLKCRCLFATHYHELTNLSNFLPALENYTTKIEELEHEILFLHNIIKGTADKSYGIHVASLAGLPKSVIIRANDILLKLEKTGTNKGKNILKTETNNLSLFTLAPETPEDFKLQKLKEEINNIVADQLSPKQALDLIYKLKELASVHVQTSCKMQEKNNIK
ncbi:DNA mismatch repair protein MutS [Pseudolycoriella hygida]|uniref:DNA mismatch repair protein MutS n=1 Tax=Pseudolycoriella hygida TaxID=35572 RepID=A0A9Q0N8T3_9DIPT|nr:DNA mismatch repair protein MutS [Pseudolycoriella hygida]